MTPFEKKLREIINEHCLENESDTPDFILTEYMLDCMDAFTDATRARDKWYGHQKRFDRLGAPAPSTVRKWCASGHVPAKKIRTQPGRAWLMQWHPNGDQ